MITKIEISKLAEIDLVVNFLLPHVDDGTVFLLNGEMAAGKTTLIASLLLKLGIVDVSSPTYAIHQVYQNHQHKIHHFDLHRLETDEDIETSGLWDCLQNTKNIFFIEWSQRINDQNWPLNLKIIQIDIEKTDSETARKISITI
jgi:tRNA threonylcarbamoyladenosine biosynthesis protein TsaE